MRCRAARRARIRALHPRSLGHGVPQPSRGASRLSRGEQRDEPAAPAAFAGLSMPFIIPRMEEAARPKELRALPSVKDVGGSERACWCCPCAAARHSGPLQRAGRGCAACVARAAQPGASRQLLNVPPCLHRSCWRRCSRRSSEGRECSERDAGLCRPVGRLAAGRDAARERGALSAPADGPGRAEAPDPGGGARRGGGTRRLRPSTLRACIQAPPRIL